MAEQAKTRLFKLVFHFGLTGQHPGLNALCIWPPTLEAGIDPHRHNHRIAADTMELAQHGQAMLGAGDVLKQLHAKMQSTAFADKPMENAEP